MPHLHQVLQLAPIGAFTGTTNFLAFLEWRSIPFFFRTGILEDKHLFPAMSKIVAHYGLREALFLGDISGSLRIIRSLFGQSGLRLEG
jgi:hypothetical protein